MQEITYRTASGEESSGTLFDLTESAAFGSADSRSWEWSVDSATGAASRGAKTYEAELAFYGEGAKERANRFFALCDVDVSEGKVGTLCVDGWQLKCNLVSGSRQNIRSDAAYYKIKLYARFPIWRKITRYSFMPDSSTGTVTTGLDYPTDYPYDYAGTAPSAEVADLGVTNDSLVRLTFFGSCSKPYCRITSTQSNGQTVSNIYAVDADAAIGERIVIDPTAKGELGSSIYRVGRFGERTNLFNARRRGTLGSGSYVFQPVKSGRLSISWPQYFGLDIELIEERGALPWS